MKLFGGSNSRSHKEKQDQLKKENRLNASGGSGQNAPGIGAGAPQNFSNQANTPNPSNQTQGSSVPNMGGVNVQAPQQQGAVRHHSTFGARPSVSGIGLGVSKMSMGNNSSEQAQSSSVGNNANASTIGIQQTSNSSARQIPSSAGVGFGTAKVSSQEMAAMGAKVPQVSSQSSKESSINSQGENIIRPRQGWVTGVGDVNINSGAPFGASEGVRRVNNWHTTPSVNTPKKEDEEKGRVRESFQKEGITDLNNSSTQVNSQGHSVVKSDLSQSVPEKMNDVKKGEGHVSDSQVSNTQGKESHREAILSSLYNHAREPDSGPLTSKNIMSDSSPVSSLEEKEHDVAVDQESASEGSKQNRQFAKEIGGVGKNKDEQNNKNKVFTKKTTDGSSVGEREGRSGEKKDENVDHKEKTNDAGMRESTPKPYHPHTGPKDLRALKEKEMKPEKTKNEDEKSDEITPEKTPEMSVSVLEELIAAGQGWAIAENLKNFKELTPSVAEKLIEFGQGWAVADNLKNFDQLSPSVAEKLIEFGQGWAVAENLSNFKDLPQSVAEKLIEFGQGWAVAKNLHCFKKLSREVAGELIQSGQEWYVAKNLEKFQNLSQSIAGDLIDCGKGWAVVDDLDVFREIDHQSIVEKLMELGDDWYVAKNLEKFQNLSQGVANNLIESGKGWAVVENLGAFEGIDHQSLAEKLLDFKEEWPIAENLDKFHELSQSIAGNLIESGKGWAVVENLGAFRGLDHQSIVEKLIEMGDEWAVAENLHKFHELSQSIANNLIESGKGWAVVKNLGAFRGIDYKSTAKKLIAFGQGGAVAQHLAKFDPVSVGSAPASKS